MTLAEAEKQVILTVLTVQNGHRAKTAAALGIAPRTLATRLRSYGIPARGRHCPTALPEWLQEMGVAVSPAALRTSLCDLLVAASDARDHAVNAVAAEVLTDRLADRFKGSCDLLLQRLTTVFDALHSLTPPATPPEPAAEG